MRSAYIAPVLFIALLVTIYQPLPTRAQTVREDVRTLRDIRFEVPERPLRSDKGEQSYSEDEILVKLKGDERPIRIKNSEGRSIPDLVSEYARLGTVEYAEPNYIAHTFFVPNDPYYGYQWNFDNENYGGVHASASWDTGSGNGAIVAIIDTGVAYENYGFGRNGYYLAPDLAGTTFVSGYDFVNNDTHPNDDNGHGTHVAGTIAQTTNNAAGTAGLAYGASIMPIKVLNQNGSGTYADIVDAIRYAADNGADIINMSLGGSQPSASLEEALHYAYEKGVTIVAAAGNNGQGTISYPAAYDAYVIAVGATRYDETRSPYSNYGSSLDIVAPGGDTSVDQNGDGYGDGILQQTFDTSRSSFGYYFYQGTSMATPHVAAAAALIIGAGVASTPDSVRSVLESTADDLGSSGRDNVYGHGLLNVAKALGATVSQPPQPVDNPPTVTLTGPVNGTTVNGIVTITADASDDEGDVSVDFYVDGTLYESDSSSPFEASWDTETVTDGGHALSVVATDLSSQTASDAVSITVDNSVPPLLPPSPPPPTGNTVVFTDSFESGLGQWTQDSQNDWYSSTQRATEGTRSAEIDGSAADATLTSNSIDLGGKTQATISFTWLIERAIDRGEYLAFDVSTNGGATWANLGSLNGNVDNENEWHDAQYTLSSISSLQIRFRGKMSRSSEEADVDNIVVVASS